jgi:hypothetical protein
MNTPNDDLRQTLLELHYDLLDEREAGYWRERIGSDPEVAAAWAETLRWAGQLASAAKVEGAPLPEIDKTSLDKPAANPNGAVRSSAAAALEVDKAADDAATKPASAVSGFTRTWWVASLSVLSTAAAIGLMVTGLRYVDRMPARPDAALRLQANVVPGDKAESANEYQIITSRIDETSTSGAQSMPVMPASISFSVLANNAVLFTGMTKSDERGVAKVVVPSELPIPDGATLRVNASSTAGLAQETTIEIPLEPTRCLTYLRMDRPVYRPGEMAHFRSLTLNRRSFAAHVEVPIRFELIDPSGATVPGAFYEGVTDHGVGNGSFQIPSTAPGGPYTLVAKSLDGFFPEERHEFQVRAYRVPRFKKELEFRRRSYGPGETVEAEFSAERAEGGVLAGAVARITAKVDDEVIYQHKTTTTPAGTLTVSFPLPEHISTGAGQLSIAIDDGAVLETKTKTIPIQLGQVKVDFYAEGGYLVGDLNNRVYFTARNTLGEPVHIRGEILSRSGKRVATVETTRDGMGRFEFTPQHGQRYSLKIIEPVDINNAPKLPTVVKNLPVLDTGSGVFAPGEPLSLSVRTTSARPVVIRAVCRGQLIGQTKVKLRSGDNNIVLPIRDDARGVVRVTMLDDNTTPARPLVERLVFRRDHKQLNINVVEAATTLERSPGEPVRLTLQVTDEAGNPAPAVLGVSVVDDAALSLQEHELPTMRTHFLLTSEVEKPEDLEHANFYLSKDPEAAESLDLLLGTQGWRRFVTGSPAQPNVDFREQLVRLLELDGDTTAAVPASFDNVSVFRDDWRDYRAAMGHAWSRLLAEARLVLLVLIGLWMLVVLIKLHRNAVAGVASWLLIASTAALISGCGVQDASVVTATDAMKTESEYAAEESAEGMGNSAAPERSMPELPAPLDDQVSAEPEAEALPTDPSQSSSRAEDSSVRRANGLQDDGREDLADSDPPWGNKDAEFADVGAKLPTNLISAEQLQQLLAARGLDAEALADQLLDELRFPIRQYAHRYSNTQSDVRSDFTETLYWQPMLITDSTGKATIRFDLSDSVTTFRISVDGHTDNGRIGSGTSGIRSRIPFQIEPKLPLEVTTGDRIDLPVAIINTTENPIGVAVDLKADSDLKPLGETSPLVSVNAGGRTREYFSLEVADGGNEQDAFVEIGASGGSGDQRLSDKVRRTLHISPAGYPARESIAGVLDQRSKIRLPIPDQIVPGSLAVTVRAYPSPLADLMSGVEGILREPHGCFEQTSATNYPNTMALLYMQRNNIAKPEVTRTATGLLDRGYGKLTSFECQQKGYEWFGQDPGHEALSAFGLMQFTDMQQVMQVDTEMMVRTRTWLMDRRDGNGGFHRNPRHLHVWSVQQEIVNAYVLWAISEADVAANQAQRTASELGPELQRASEVAQASDDPYLIALTAAALINAQQKTDGLALLKKLSELQADDGSLDGKTTVTSSGGISRKVETTALSIIAWLKSPAYLSPARNASKWLVASRQGSGFGSTQATVLALKALVAMSDHTSTQSGGTLTIRYDSQVIGEAVLTSDPRGGDAVEITGLGEQLDLDPDHADSPEIELEAAAAQRLAYSIEILYHAITPASDPACPVKVTTELSGLTDQETIAAGKTLTVKTALENTSDQGQPMTVAIVGLPGGVEPDTGRLDELMEAGKFDYYELRGREVVFYWRTIEPKATKSIDFTVTATIPGKYTGPASRAYLYYTAEQKQWTKPLQVTIQK